MTLARDPVRVFQALHEIAVAVGGVLEPIELARVVVGHVGELLDAPAVGIYSYAADTNVLQPLFSSDADDYFPAEPLRPGYGVAGVALQIGQPVVVNDYPNWPNAAPWAVTNGVRAAIGVPLQVADHITGAMSVRAYEPRQWTSDDVQMLTLLAAQVAPALEAARLHERTRTAGRHAEAAINLRDEVLAGVSHDLAGPLARIRLYAEMIQTETIGVHPPALAEQLAAWSERIIVATDSMKLLMQELVDVARVQMGHGLKLDLREVDLVQLAQRLGSDQTAAGRTVVVSVTTPELRGWWDETRLARVLGNLLDNALNYSAPGASVELAVSHLPDRSDEAQIQVRDRGRGIPPDELSRVFERFYRGSNAASETRGSGLGLAVARQIVEHHGGTIQLDSVVGRGTTVTVTLPRTRPPADDADPRGPAPSG
jgi:signal transduction histidine kinase